MINRSADRFYEHIVREPVGKSASQQALALYSREHAVIWEDDMANKKAADDNNDELRYLIGTQATVVANLSNALDKAAATIEKLMKVIDEATEPDEDEQEEKEAT